VTEIPQATEPTSNDEKRVVTRRWMLLGLGALINGVVGVAVAVPVVRYLLGPIRRNGGYDSWIVLGAVDDFPVGETRLATYKSPYSHPWDGETANTACWVRRTGTSVFQVFAVNCAHLGCPVRWFPQSGLFMCPCHGGAYYADGSRASGPPERGLFEYDYKVENSKLHIKAGQMPTLSTEAGLRVLNNSKGCGSCAG
jgi:Rieske Fe-S protein